MQFCLTPPYISRGRKRKKVFWLLKNIGLIDLRLLSLSARYKSQIKFKGDIMREQYTIRIYDSKLANKLERLFNENKDIYGSKNPFFVDCISRGVETIERDFNGQTTIEDISQLYNEIHLTVEKLNNLIRLCEKNAKENIANLTVNQKLLSCNYNMLLGLSAKTPKQKEYVEAGLYDDLPERLSELLEDVLKVYLKK